MARRSSIALYPSATAASGITESNTSPGFTVPAVIVTIAWSDPATGANLVARWRYLISEIASAA